MKSESTCYNCVSIKSDNGVSLSTTKAGTWEKMTVSFSQLGITGGKFRNFLFQGNTASSQVFYLDDVKLIKSASYTDSGKCSK
jgi:hypothetical protein